MNSPFPRPQPFSRGEVWALTADEAERIDSDAITSIGVPQSVLMENAGRGAAAVVAKAYRGCRVLGLVGAGNNGGDTLVALRSLAAWGVPVRAILVGDRAENDPLLHAWPLDVVRDTDLDDDAWAQWIDWADVMVDGMLGTGARGAPRARQATVINRVCAHDGPVVSLDLPSGVDASTGAIPGAAVRADLTVAFGAPKVGALLHPGRACTGRHVVVEIGFPPIEAGRAGAWVVTPNWARAHLPARSPDAHKNQVGRVLIVGGAQGMAGAVVLAARAAFASGAGRVHLCSSPANRRIIQSSIPEAIFVSADDGAALSDAVDGADVVAVGPGLGIDPWARHLLTSTVERGDVPLVLDADALNLASEGVIDLPEVATRRAVLITPHPGEMTRLESHDLPSPAPDSTVERARGAAARLGCTVLLKGAPSVVAEPVGPVAIDTQGSSDLAVAGMGDTLTGVCASLMARGCDPGTGASLGLYLSGRAATLSGRGAGVIPSDVARWLPEALGDVGRCRTDLGLPFVCFDADPTR